MATGLHVRQTRPAGMILSCDEIHSSYLKGANPRVHLRILTFRSNNCYFHFRRRFQSTQNTFAFLVAHHERTLLIMHK